MKNIYSLISCCIICIVLLGFRIPSTDLKSNTTLRITTWDALGYYMYLPGICIYQDVTKLDWFFEIDREYYLSANCMKCLFYMGNEEKGRCRFNPPAVSGNKFPTVYPDFWCGQFILKEPINVKVKINCNNNKEGEKHE